MNDAVIYGVGGAEGPAFVFLFPVPWLPNATP
jgi:hypothetical protein